MSLADPFDRAAVHAEAEILIDAPIDRVWALLTQVDRWPRWNPAVRGVAPCPALAPGVSFVWRSGGVRIRSTVQNLRAPTELGWSGAAFGTRATHHWHLQTTRDGVRVRTEESFSGWLPRLMPGAMQRTLDAALPQWLGALKAAAQHNHGLCRP